MHEYMVYLSKIRQPAIKLLMEDQSPCYSWKINFPAVYLVEFRNCIEIEKSP